MLYGSLAFLLFGAIFFASTRPWAAGIPSILKADPSEPIPLGPALAEYANRVLLVGVLSTLANLVLFVPAHFALRRQRCWAWKWQTVALALSMVVNVVLFLGCGMMLLIPGLILLIYWRKPEVRAFLRDSATEMDNAGHGR